jgi:hypothetical protein
LQSTRFARAAARGRVSLAVDKLDVTTIATLTVPIGGQQIELQQLDYVHGGLPLLRTRIREGKRFTIFDIDHQSAAQWGEALLRWAREVAARTSP